MDSIFFEKQEAALCAQHALNMLLQGSYFTAVDLAELARELDRRESGMLNNAAATSQNMDDSGYFSVQVVQHALNVWNLELVPLRNPRAAPYRQEPTVGRAYICNHREHWFTVRKFGFQWLPTEFIAQWATAHLGYLFEFVLRTIASRRLFDFCCPW